jgi:SAM-dependent methyltransferase
MKVFSKYAHYYDLLYKDKDYAAEAEYVHRLLRKYAPGTKSVLELGCGTGIHAHLLSGMGYRLHGVDRSPAMLESASRRVPGPGSVPEAQPAFSLGDVRGIRMNDKFDAVISLFHVMSYQTTNDEISASLATAKFHLNPGGILVFDCWYGPAVLSQKPEIRIKRFEDDRIQVTRIAEPTMHPDENIVDVNYQVSIRNKSDGSVEELRETHRMRYLFTPEVVCFLSQHGLKLLDSFEWMSGREPGFDTWGVCFVAQA